MTAPTWQNVLDALNGTLHQKALDLIAAAQAALPAGVTLTDPQLDAIVNSALDAGTLSTIKDAALADLRQLFTTGSGPIGGPDASLA